MKRGVGCEPVEKGDVRLLMAERRAFLPWRLVYGDVGRGHYKANEV